MITIFSCFSFWSKSLFGNFLITMTSRLFYLNFLWLVDISFQLILTSFIHLCVTKVSNFSVLTYTGMFWTHTCQGTSYVLTNTLIHNLQVKKKTSNNAEKLHTLVQWIKWMINTMVSNSYEISSKHERGMRTTFFLYVSSDNYISR